MSVSLSGTGSGQAQQPTVDITGQMLYEVKSGRTTMQLKLGSMAIQLLKKDKVEQSILYEHMQSWEPDDTSFTIHVHEDDKVTFPPSVSARA